MFSIQIGSKALINDRWGNNYADAQFELISVDLRVEADVIYTLGHFTVSFYLIA